MTQAPKALCLMGPTASGKTRVSLELARHHNFDIISVDSALVYKGLDIGSGKPDAKTLAEIPHQLVNICDPAEPYSAADFRRDAIEAMNNSLAKGKIPLLVGGTMLYFKVLRDGLAEMPEADEEVRQQILTLADKEGWPAIHTRLSAVDPESAARIQPTDSQRLQRALEVYELTGKTMTELHQKGKDSPNTALPAELNFVAIYPQERARVHELIEIRFRQMLDDGLIEEVKALYKRGDLNASLPAIRSVGYRQVWEYLDEQYDYDTMIEKALAATRQLAKRQFTWLRSWPNLTIFDSEVSNLEELCLKSL